IQAKEILRLKAILNDILAKNTKQKVAKIVKDTERDFFMSAQEHTNFNPLVSRFKDYIALPKQNGYQTIHTTLFDTKNIIEAQIR
ncbi:ATP-dependent Clp protease proteolytic subunit, partial [Campylobacter coli]